jgi:hypothetical protein
VSLCKLPSSWESFHVFLSPIRIENAFVCVTLLLLHWHYTAVFSVCIGLC